MPPKKLPPHLSYKSALVLLPPKSIREPIQNIRYAHDKQYYRWPPHINLLYPFISQLHVASSSVEQVSSSVEAKSTMQREQDDEKEETKEMIDRRAYDRVLKDIVVQRIRKAVSQISPFRLVLNSRPEYFIHNKSSATVWLDPQEEEERNGEAVENSGPDAQNHSRHNTDEKNDGTLRKLQSVLQSEFPECDADKRGFVPHLSLGQARGESEAEALKIEAEAIIKESVGKEKEEVEAESAISKQNVTKSGLDWAVDRVFVIERRGYHDPFLIVGEIYL